MLHFNKLSYWEKETYINHTDLVVIGSGIVGLSTAIHYKERNPHKKVTVLERGYLPTGASTKNAGFACIGSPSELLADLENEAENEVFLTVRRRMEGLNYLRKLLGDEAIGYEEFGSHELFRKADYKTYEKCRSQLAYLNKRLEPITGQSETFIIDENYCAINRFKGFTHAIQHRAEGQINTGKMVAALLSLAQAKGVIILNGIEAISIHNEQLQTNYGEIPFRQIAICTNGFAKKMVPNEDIEPARAQVIITKPIKNLHIKGIFHFDEGYYYFRNIDNRILFGGGRNLNFKGENTTELTNSQEITNELERILQQEILPNTPFEIDYSWAGIMGIGLKKSPMIKQISPSVFCGIRLGGMGVAIGTLVGKELAELMAKNDI